MAAGIYLTRETAYMTFGDHDILVRDNTLSQIETMPPSYEPSGFKGAVTGHGAIEIGSTIFSDEFANPTWRQAFTISDIALINNTVSHARFAGIRIGVGFSGTNTAQSSGASFTRAYQPGFVQNVLVQGDSLSSVNSAGVIEAHNGLDPTTISCTNNILNGASWGVACTSALNGAAAPPNIPGASVQCTGQGVLDISVSPKAPALDTSN